MKNFNDSVIIPSIDVKENICSCIDRWLTKNNITNAAFGRKLGVSGQSVTRWRNRECIPDVALLPIICDILDTDLSEMFGVQDKNKSFIEKLYKTDEVFKKIADKYKDDPEFNALLKSLAKIQK